MSFKPFKQLLSSDPELARLASNIRDWAEQFGGIEILNGRLIEDIAVTTSGIDVSHGLGRIPKGWFVVEKDGNGNIWSTGKTRHTLSLDTSGDVNISIWVF